MSEPIPEPATVDTEGLEARIAEMRERAPELTKEGLEASLLQALQWSMAIKNGTRGILRFEEAQELLGDLAVPLEQFSDKLHRTILAALSRSL